MHIGLGVLRSYIHLMVKGRRDEMRKDFATTLPRGTV